MATYIALVNYTDKGIANIKDSPGRLDKARALLREMVCVPHLCGILR